MKIEIKVGDVLFSLSENMEVRKYSQFIATAQESERLVKAIETIIKACADANFAIQKP